MRLTTYWTVEAQRSFHEIDHFVRVAWGEEVAEAFAEDVIHTITLLEIFPNGGVIEVADKRSGVFQ